MGHDVNTGRITYPVSTDDIRLVLGEDTDDVVDLCMSDSINPWAKFKPEAHGTMRDLTLEVRRQYNFGLSAAQTYDAVRTFIDAVADGAFKGGWVYKKVTDSFWGRINDFDGYNHYARSPLGTLNPQTLETGDGADLIVSALSPPGVDEGDGVISGADARGEISFSEFRSPDGNDYGNWYFGILLYRNAGDYKIATSAIRMSEKQIWQVNFGKEGGSGTYRGVPFISSARISPGGDFPQKVSIAGCGSNGVEITLVAAKDQYFHSGYCEYPDAARNTVDYRVSIRNNSTQPYTTDVVLQVASDSRGSNSQTIAQFRNVSVPAGGYWSKEGSADISYSGVASTFYRWFKFGSSGWVSITVRNPDIEKPQPWEPE